MLALPNEVEVLARLVAKKTGQTPEDVVAEAVRASARSVGVRQSDAADRVQDAMIEAAKAIARRSAARPVHDSRSDDDILGYDKHGIAK